MGICLIHFEKFALQGLGQGVSQTLFPPQLQTFIAMGNLKKKRRLQMNKHKRKKRLKANRHKKRTWQK
jgi:hypothetical protein